MGGMWGGGPSKPPFKIRDEKDWRPMGVPSDQSLDANIQASIRALRGDEPEPEQETALAPIEPTSADLATPDKILDYLWRLDSALSETYDVAEVLQIQKRVDAIKFLQDKEKMDISIRTRATESQIRTKYRLGQLLLAMNKNKGARGNPGGQGVPLHDATAQTYKDLDIDPTAAFRAQTLAKVPEEKIEAFVKQVHESEHELTIGGVVKYARNVVRKAEREARGAIPFPPGKYRVIVADPPWEYDNSGFAQSAESKYPTMPTKEICNLDIPSLYDDEAVLFLWATSPLLPDALEVMKAWGFEYKASMVWEKNAAPGIGWFVQTYHEFLLIGVKGTGMHPDYQPKSTFTGSVTEHSKKPDGPFETIERMYKGPYIELFARRAREGWEVWGNEV